MLRMHIILFKSCARQPIDLFDRRLHRKRVLISVSASDRPACGKTHITKVSLTSSKFGVEVKG